jgi:signal transduction histidine kinase
MNLLSSLTNRIFLASAMLVIVSMGIAIYRVNVSVASQAERDLRNGLAEAASLVDQLSRTQFTDFVVKGQLIADLPLLSNAVATEDPPTVQPIAQEYQVQIGADLFIVVGRLDRVLAQAGRIQVDEDTVAGMLAACRTSRDGTHFWPFAGGLLHVVAIPMEAGLSTLLVGMSLDRQVAMTIKRVTNAEIAFVTGARVVASSLSAPPEAALGALASRSDIFPAIIGSEEYLGRVQPLGRGEGADEPVALVLRSRTEHLSFLPLLRRQIALTGLAAVVVATLVGYLVARSVTRPLRALSRAMGEMAATGDLARTAPALGRWDDEDVRRVATTFHQLTSALDRFQREASLRERLSSLGRLSTVVAHEIRNPLMIIKTAVRHLRRHPSTDVVEVARSIDEEVLRLNNVVTGVLDFARPIEFALAPSDLGIICRDAAQAAAAAADDVPVEVEATTAPIVTDAERLRSVLINIFTNAQHAVRAKADRGEPTAPIRVTTSPEPGGRWRIVVVDRGIGIAPEHLPRIFDPFFTTRSNGSGLGLAIARNVVEGLGGTLTVQSRPGEGTTVTIELPDRAETSELTA